MLFRAWQSRMMHDFFLYAEKNGANKTDCSAENVVLRLSEGIPPHQNFKLYFNNWFCTSPLCLELKSVGILTTATIRANRISGCPLKCGKDLKKERRGSSSHRSDANSGIVLSNQYDGLIINQFNQCLLTALLAFLALQIAGINHQNGTYWYLSQRL